MTVEKFVISAVRNKMRWDGKDEYLLNDSEDLLTFNEYSEAVTHIKE